MLEGAARGKWGASAATLYVAQRPEQASCLKPSRPRVPKPSLATRAAFILTRKTLRKPKKAARAAGFGGPRKFLRPP